MVMLKGYAHMVDFFTNFDWWKADPHDELVTGGAYCLAKPGEIYAVYLPLRPLGGVSESLEFKRDYRDVTIQLESGPYEATWFDPLSGEWIPAGTVQGPNWKLPKTPVWHDAAMLLKRSK